ncbi:nickel/cobalt transporter [Ruegeria hyattellae]|uniref:nickel/cobalt transporter n=1 Tax=Ruegeria hyattellae TaxID=3233337 RepID=UPI00355BDFF7
MSKLLILPVGVAAALLLWLWAGGGFDQLSVWAAGEQRAFQNQIAGALRGLRAGHEGALWLLMGLCFAYGFFHAVGPGHGKVLIGGYGLGRKVPWLRLSVISLLASLGQAVTAVAIVYAGVFLFDMTRERLVGVTEDVMAPLSYGAIALVGLWLVWRGVRRLMRQRDTHAHDHDTCESCGHKHGPDLGEIDQVSTPREALALIASIAIRPCTGALFVLLITWQMGIGGAGIAGAFAMALGTASVTIAVGLAATGMRGGIAGSANAFQQAARVLPLVELMAGLVVAMVAGGLMMRAL